MLSVIASDVLAVVEQSTLKNPPSVLPPSYALANEYHASAWASDNSALYLVSTHTISRYDPSMKQLTVLHTENNGHVIRCLAVKEGSTLIYGAGNNIHILECGSQKPKLIQSLGPHNHDILSLSLSNDSSLLACGLSDAAYVHNLSTGAQTTLRGLPSKPSIATCVFHPHARTRLLVGSRDQLFVYDTTRPSAPTKVIPMGSAGTCIQATACSPFSKTLVAVAMSNGGVGLVDLDKDKGLFRTLSLNVPLTTISFSPEGANIYLGTEDGRLLVQNLRALDKPPKSIIVSSSGNPITTLAVQKKLKDSPYNIKPQGTPKTLTKSMTSTPISKAASSPLRSRTARTGSSFAATPTRKAPTTGTPKRTSSAATGTKKILSPARDPYGNSPRLGSEEIITAKAKKAHPLASVSTISKHGSSSAKASLPSGATGRITSSTATKRRISSATADSSVATQLENTVAEGLSSISQAQTRPRTRTSTSVAPSASVSVASRTARTVSSTSTSSATSRRKHSSSSTPPVPPVPSISAEFIAYLHPVPPILKPNDASRTPSPDLPDMRTDPVTPIPTRKKKKAMAVLGLGTPEASAWIKAGVPAGRVSQRAGAKGKGRVKSVGFKEDFDDVDDHDNAMEGDDLDFNEDEVRECEKSLSLQISPRRPLPASSLSQSRSHGHSHSWDASPMRSRQTTHAPGTPSAGTAHELLRTIVKDVMYDYQRETRAEMMGLHLDLVRMGRGWKQELRTLMDEYVGDLNDLRDENRRLREENDRLRRG